MSPLLDGRLFVALGGDRESPNKAFGTNNEFAATVLVGSNECVYVRCAISVVRQQRQFGMETIRVQEPIGSYDCLIGRAYLIRPGRQSKIVLAASRRVLIRE